MVDDTVAIEVAESAPGGLGGSLDERAIGSQQVFEKGRPIGHRLKRQVVRNPILEVADVEHAGAPPMAFHDVGAPVLIKVQAGGILD